MRVRGKRTTKRAPRPSSGGSSVHAAAGATRPPRARSTSPRPDRAAAVAVRRGRSARRPCRCSSGGMPGPVVLDREHDLAVAALDASPRPRCPGRCGAARSPSGSARAGAARRARPRPPAPRRRGDRDLVVAGHRLELGRRVGDDARRGRPGGAAARGPASARASSSRSATSRRIRREERSAEAAASRCSPSSASSSSSRLASTEVSGVRSSCEASATNSRWRASVASVSRARLVERVRASPRACAASSATSSSASGRGMRSDGSRVRSISRAASVSSAIGSIARRAVARPASSASAAPPSTPRPRNSFTRLAVACTSESRRAYWTYERVAGAGRASTRARLDPPAVDLLASARDGGAEVRARRRCSSIGVAARVTTRIAAFVAAPRRRRGRAALARRTRVPFGRRATTSQLRPSAASRSAAPATWRLKSLVDRARRQHADDHGEAAAGSPASAPRSRRRAASGSAGAYTRRT